MAKKVVKDLIRIFMVSPSKSSPGFTLVEMLVVILLVGLSLGVLLSFELLNNKADQESQIRSFANTLNLLSGKAVLEGKTFGLDFFIPEDQVNGPLAYRWLVLENNSWQELEYLNESDEASEVSQQTELLRGQAFLTSEAKVLTDGLELKFELSALEVARDKVMPLKPEIFLYPTRELTAFKLVLLDNNGFSDELNVDLMGRILVNADAPSLP